MGQKTKTQIKMVIATDFSKIFEPIYEPTFDFDQVQSNKINGARPFQTLRCEKTCINSENGTWEKSFSLEMLPTKVEDLKVKVEMMDLKSSRNMIGQEQSISQILLTQNISKSNCRR